MMYSGWMTGIGWLWGLPMALLVLLLLAAVYFVARGSRSRGGVAVHSPEQASAETVLKIRYARGEISAEEYESMLRRLRR